MVMEIKTLEERRDALRDEVKTAHSELQTLRATIANEEEARKRAAKEADRQRQKDIRDFHKEHITQKKEMNAEVSLLGVEIQAKIRDLQLEYAKKAEEMKKEHAACLLETKRLEDNLARLKARVANA